MSSAVEKLTKIAIGASGGSSGSETTIVNCMSFDIGVRLELRDTNGTRGTFDKDGNRVKENRDRVSPRISSEPTYVEWAVLLPWITSGTPSGSPTVTYPFVATAVPNIQKIYFNPNAGDSYELTGCAVDSATFRAAVGEPLSVDLDIVGQTYTTSPSAFPSLTPDQVGHPFILSDLVLLIGGSTIQTREFSYKVSNNIDRERFLNSLTLTRTQILHREHMFTFDVPSGDNASLWDNGVAGATMVATFTDATSGSTSVMVFTVPDLRFPGQSPQFAPNAEGFVRIEGEAYRTVGNSAPVGITLHQ